MIKWKRFWAKPLFFREHSLTRSRVRARPAHQTTSTLARQCVCAGPARERLLP